MIKQTLTYTDYTGEEQTDSFWFHLTEADVLELEVSANGNSLAAWIEKITKAQNGAEIIETFKKIIAVSYGVKSDDGRRFIKNPQLLEEFKSTKAYSKLFFLLATDAKVGSEFVNGIMPEEMKKEMAMSSEQARKASEERMQGFKKPQPKETQSTIERQPDLPVETSSVVLEAAPPVLAPGEQQGPPPVNPETTQLDVNSMSAEQLRELVTRQGGFPQNMVQ